MNDKAETLTALCALGVTFILGTWWGLFLNLTHMHRMQRWANEIVDRLDIK